MAETRKIYSFRFFYLLLVLFYIAGSIAVVALVGFNLREQALHNAERLSRLILEKNLATHAYFSHTLKPKVFELADRLNDPDYFEPGWMSSTYAIREIDAIFQDNSGENYYYKECAIDARNSANEADAFERAFIEEANADSALTVRSLVRTIDEKPFFLVLHRGEVIDQNCLRCHSTPDRAPQGLVRMYGSSRSFNRELGEVVSAISIRIPLAHAYEDANYFTVKLSALLLSILVGLFVLHSLAGRALVFAPLKRLRRQVAMVSTDPAHLGDRIAVPKGRELAELTESFNTMSVALRREKDGLEEQVALRTRQLEAANQQLLQDIADREEAEARIHQLAYYDGLTGLPNRTLFIDRLRLALAHARRERMRLAVMFVDLDNFKVVNDTLGHEAGDRFLKVIAGRLQDQLREEDTIARFGGDEFVFFGYIAEDSEPTILAGKILSTLARPVSVEGMEFVTTGSVGIAIYPDDGTSDQALLRLADAAMYCAKAGGRNTWCVHGGEGN